MKSFPFTDYDFYGYLSCGLVLLFAIDYWHTGGQYLIHDNWTFLQTTFALALAYVTGQIIAIPSSIIIEHWLARTLLRPPVTVLLSVRATKTEQFIEGFFLGQNYRPFPESLRDKVFANAERHTNTSRVELEANPEHVFSPAFTSVRKIEDVRKRLDDFRNQYGFNRNMAMSGFISTFLLAARAWQQLMVLPVAGLFLP